MKPFIRSIYVLIAFALVGQLAPIDAMAQENEAKQYVVKKGDTLWSISKAHDTTVPELLQMNDLENNTIYPGQKLFVFIPVDETVSSTGEIVQVSGGGVADVVPAGAVAAPESVSEVAPSEVVRVDTETPAQPQPVEAQPVEPTQAEVVSVEIEEPLEYESAETTREANGGSPRVTIQIDEALVSTAFDEHVVVEGETMYTIASLYDIPVDSLWVINDEQVDPLEPGQRLRIPINPDYMLYTVEPGDTIARIGKWFSVDPNTLKKINRLQSGSLKVGQQLRIPQYPEMEIVDSGEATAGAESSSTSDFERERAISSLEPDIEKEPAELSGEIRLYPEQFAGRLMANGKPYEPNRFTISHPSIPIGTVVLLKSDVAGTSTFAEVTDRPPPQADYAMDMSRAVAKALELDRADEPIVRIKVVE